MTGDDNDFVAMLRDSSKVKHLYGMRNVVACSKVVIVSAGYESSHSKIFQDACGLKYLSYATAHATSSTETRKNAASCARPSPASKFQFRCLTPSNEFYIVVLL